jgi:hypothetical protein
LVGGDPILNFQSLLFWSKAIAGKEEGWIEKTLQAKKGRVHGLTGAVVEAELGPGSAIVHEHAGVHVQGH